MVARLSLRDMGTDIQSNLGVELKVVGASDQNASWAPCIGDTGEDQEYAGCVICFIWLGNVLKSCKTCLGRGTSGLPC